MKFEYDPIDIHKKIMKDKKYESFVLMVVWVKYFYDDVHVIE